MEQPLLPAPTTSLDSPAGEDVVSDVLSSALENSLLRSGFPGELELSAPWGLDVSGQLGWFYLVGGAGCWAQGADGTPFSVSPGDLILATQGHPHRLGDQPDSPRISLQSVLDRRRPPSREPRTAGRGPVTRLACGCFLFDHLAQSPWYAALPAFMHVRGENRRALPYVDHIFRLLALETAGQEPCAPLIINRLVRILFMKAIQSYAAQLPATNSTWLRALSDPEMGHVLGLMHAHPEVRWTVAALARHVAMARSSFAARFVRIVGQPPLEYLTRWRMQRAGHLIRTTNDELKQVAAQVGYESCSAFTKAFVRWMGATPSRYRQSPYVAPAVSHGMPPT